MDNNRYYSPDSEHNNMHQANLGRVVSHKFGGLVQKYETIILNGINADVKHVNASMAPGALKSMLHRFHSQYLQESSHREMHISPMFPHNYYNQVDGLYSSLSEVLTVALKVVHEQGTNYVLRMYLMLVGISLINEFQDVSKLLREIGITVIACKHSILKMDGSGRLDFGGTDFQSETLLYNRNVVNEYRSFLRPDSWTRTKQAMQSFDSAGENPFEMMNYMTKVSENIKRVLQSRDPAQPDGMTVEENLVRLYHNGQDGSCFFTKVSLDLPTGHMNMIRYTFSKDRIQMFCYEPHGEIHGGSHYGAPQVFLKLMVVYIGVFLKINCTVDAGFCPNMQGSLGLCGMYSVYFAVIDHLNRGMSSAERAYALESLCTGSTSIIPRATYSSKDYKGFSASMRSSHKNSLMTRINGVAQDDTCDLDTIFLMLVAFYGCGRRRLYDKDKDMADFDPYSFKQHTLRSNSRIMRKISTHPQLSS